MLLNDIGLKYGADKSSRFHNYLDFYQEQLPDRDFSGRLLEIGVMDGASMKMWREYYPKAEIVGIDIKPMAHLHNNSWKVPESVRLIQCDGTDPQQVKKLGMFDVIIDDGSHYTAQQQASFDLLYYKQLNRGGVYIIEDLWTSHIKEYVKTELTTLEWLKSLEPKGIQMTYFKHSHNGIEKVFPKYEGLDSETVAIKALGFMSPIGLKPHAKDVLAAGAKILDGLGMKWWLSAGTALGFHRGGGFIPHDTDIDVGVEGLHPDLVQAFINGGFAEYMFNQDFQRAFSKGNVVFDIYIFNKQGNKMVSDTSIGRIIKPYKLFTQLGAIKFDGKEYPAPSPIEEYLEIRFGSDWRIPQKKKGLWYENAPCVELNEENQQ